MTSIKTIIIDDEQAGQNYLKGLLESNCPQVDILAICGSITEAIEKIHQLSPELVFLDIKLPGGTGFDVLSQTSSKDLNVIFTTAHEQYSLKAIKFSALDYLLKPIKPSELIEAVNKHMSSKTHVMNSKIELLLQNLQAPKQLPSIALPTLQGYTFVDLDTIIRCVGDGAYSRVHFSSGEDILVSRNLKEMQELLDNETSFIRVHKSHLINIAHVRQYVKGGGGYLVMSNGDNVDVSKQRKDEFIRRFKK